MLFMIKNSDRHVKTIRKTRYIFNNIILIRLLKKPVFKPKTTGIIRVLPAHVKAPATEK